MTTTLTPRFYVGDSVIFFDRITDAEYTGTVLNILPTGEVEFTIEKKDGFPYSFPRLIAVSPHALVLNHG